ncbi:MAG: hypothetical protein ABJH07_18185 [Sedimentitalea sp.]|uniref:hypothetical protein n=1 Tax=Sedimentitalea sp. TaxID=2048915 RepID=UPI0032676176
MDYLAFATSTGLALVLTNIDNLLVLFVIQIPLGAARALTGYVVAQVLVLGVSVAVSLGASDVLSGRSGYLGVVPIAMGIRGIYVARRARQKPEPDGDQLPRSSGLIALILMFLGMSADTFGVLVPILTDSLPGYRLWGVAGALLAIAAMALTAYVPLRHGGLAPGWTKRAEPLGSYVMIVAGLYVLSDSATDLL